MVASRVLGFFPCSLFGLAVCLWLGLGGGLSVCLALSSKNVLFFIFLAARVNLERAESSRQGRGKVWRVLFVR